MTGLNTAGLVAELVRAISLRCHSHPGEERRAATERADAAKQGLLAALTAQAAELAEARGLAKKMSDALLKVRPFGGSELFTRVGEEFYADPAYCGGEIDRLRGANHELRMQAHLATRSRDEALAALKAAEEATDERIDTAWADGARFVMNELDSLIPDSPLVRSKLVDIDLRIAQRYADAIASRKNRRARSALENSKARLADATPGYPGTEQREVGRG